LRLLKHSTRAALNRYRFLPTPKYAPAERSEAIAVGKPRFQLAENRAFGERVGLPAPSQRRC